MGYNFISGSRAVSSYGKFLLIFVYALSAVTTFWVSGCTSKVEEKSTIPQDCWAEYQSACNLLDHRHYAACATSILKIMDRCVDVQDTSNFYLSALCFTTLGDCHSGQGDIGRADTCYSLAEDLLDFVPDGDTLQIVIRLTHGYVLMAGWRMQDAEFEFKQALDTGNRLWGEGHIALYPIYDALYKLYFSDKRFDSAATYAQYMFNLDRSGFSLTDSLTLSDARGLVTCLRVTGRYNAESRLLNEIIDSLDHEMTPESKQSLDIRFAYADLLVRRQHPTEADSALSDVVRRARLLYGSRSADLWEMAATVANEYVDLGNLLKADTLSAEVAEIAESDPVRFGRALPNVLNARADILRRLGRTQEAEILEARADSLKALTSWRDSTDQWGIQ